MRDWLIQMSIKIYEILLPISWIALAVAILVVFPLMYFRKTRGAAGRCLVFISYLFGVTTWFLGAAVTFISFSWVGLAIGILVFGIGVVPLGIFGAFFKLGINDLGVSICVMPIITLAARLIGVAAISRADGS